MMSFLVKYVGLLLASGTIVASQFVQAPTNWTSKTGFAGIPIRYKEVPVGTCELDPKVKSYSGYADVGENEHMFFWFFEARNQDPVEAPLTVWINGGPGSSSMHGIFSMIGPCKIKHDNVANNPYSWSNASNVLFIDQPVTTGFSYTKPVPAYTDPELRDIPNATCTDRHHICGTYSWPNASVIANTTAEAAPNFWRTLQGFMGVFPQYTRHGLHFGTQSYGGHYGPVFSTYIKSQNDLIKAGRLDAHDIKLESVMIGNGWFDPLIQYAALYNFTVSPGNTYDYSPFDARLETRMYDGMYGKGGCYDQTLDCQTTGTTEVCNYATVFCDDKVRRVLKDMAHRNGYDIRKISHDHSSEPHWASYLNTPKVQAAIGAYINFSSSSSETMAAFTSSGDKARESGIIEDIRSLIKDNVTVVLYAGDADYYCNWLGIEIVAEKINPPGFSDAGYTNMTTPDGIVHGQVKQAGAFTFVRMFNAGHVVPHDQPLASLEMFRRVLAGKDIASGTINVIGGSSYKTIGSKRSTYREGNSTVQVLRGQS